MHATLERAPRMPPEDDEGSIEYKWRLSSQSLARLEGLATQMKFRLVEGGGKAQYYIGYRDDGEPKGLLRAELDSSLDTLAQIAHSVSATVTVKHVFLVHSRVKTKKVADPASLGDGCSLFTALCEISAAQVNPTPLSAASHLHAHPSPSRFVGRVAFVGRPGSGRTTLIGALVSETRDDGRGSLRLSTSKLVHEVLNGGTTCAATPHFLDIPTGRIELLDLPAVSGKYRKTLFKALVSKPVDLVVVVHDATDAALSWVTQLGTPLIHVRSKADVEAPDIGARSKAKVEAPEICAEQILGKLRVSPVTGRGLEELKKRIIEKLENTQLVEEEATSNQVIISVDSSWTKSDIVVVGGVLECGWVKKGMRLRLQSGRISEVCRVRDVRDEAGVHVESFASRGRYCTLAIENFRQVEEVSTATSSSGEFLVQKAAVQRAMRPPLMLASEPLKFIDCVQLEILDSGEIAEAACMVYWRGNRQEARLERVRDHWQIRLRKPGFVPKHTKLILELASRAVVAIHRPL